MPIHHTRDTSSHQGNEQRTVITRCQASPSATARWPELEPENRHVRIVADPEIECPSKRTECLAPTLESPAHYRITSTWIQSLTLSAPSCGMMSIRSTPGHSAKSSIMPASLASIRIARNFSYGVIIQPFVGRLDTLLELLSCSHARIVRVIPQHAEQTWTGRAYAMPAARRSVRPYGLEHVRSTHRSSE
jgi:hypothetical protein